MKKIGYIIILLCVSIFTFAQEDVSEEQSGKEKKAKTKADPSEYLPVQGDFAIGVDALPYINFVGNMFNGTQNQNLNVYATTLYGKYFLNSESAIRVELYINNIRDMDMNLVVDDANVAANPLAEVEDRSIINNVSYAFGAGYQRYRGYGRLRGTYGAVASYHIARSNTSYEWGNQMTVANTTPTSTNWPSTATINPTERNLEERNSGTLSLSVGAIAGIEYFLAKKFCIGGEIGLYYSFTKYSETSYTYQTVQQGTVREMDQVTSPRDNYRRFHTTVYDSENVAGRLYLLFHF